MTSKINKKSKQYGLEKICRYANNEDWVYCGGDSDQHARYWKVFKEDYNWGDWTPKWRAQCICNHDIHKNCWVYNYKMKKFAVIGSKCIKKFKLTKRCSVCNIEHRNYVVNKCNECRIGKCDICDCNISKSYKKCRSCNKIKKIKNIKKIKKNL